jgi:hypothetical protein
VKEVVAGVALFKKTLFQLDAGRKPNVFLHGFSLVNHPFCRKRAH